MRPPLSTVCLVLLHLLAGCTSFDRTIQVEWQRSSNQSDWIPLDVRPSNHLFVPGQVNGQQTTILVDSGAGITVLDRAFAGELGLAQIGRTTASGVAGTEPAGIVRIPSIQIGDLTLRGVLAITLDLSPIARRIAHEMPVVLGISLFNSAVVEIDYPQSRLALHRPEQFEYRGSGRTVKLRGSGLKTVQCQIEDLPPAWFQLDTGSGKSLSVFEDYAAENDLPDPAARRSTRLGGGVGGFALESVASLESFRFAGYALHNVPANFPTPKTGAFTGKSYAGNLGGGILRRFHLWLDFRRLRMHVEPGPDLDMPFRRDHLGLVTEVRGDDLVVLHVSLASPAKESGIEKGVIITHVDGRSGSANRLRRRLFVASRRRIGAVIRIRDAAGREYLATLAPHY